ANAKISKTIFSSFDISKVSIDTEFLESKFGNIQQSKPEKTTQIVEKKKDQLKTCLEPRRLQNVGIFLSTLKIDSQTLIEAILMLNEDILTADLIPKLLDNLPTAEEISSINEFVKNNDISKLENVDRFFYNIA